ncbi:hypothetical protein Trydic_g1163 [Trypoxylus dichotomus]
MKPHSSSTSATVTLRRLILFSKHQGFPGNSTPGSLSLAHGMCRYPGGALLFHFCLQATVALKLPTLTDQSQPVSLQAMSSLSIAITSAARHQTFPNDRSQPKNEMKRGSSVFCSFTNGRIIIVRWKEHDILN